MPDVPDALAAAAKASPRTITIPIRSPNPVTDEDAERLYSLTDECTISGDDDGPTIELPDDSGAVERVLSALRHAGFSTAFDSLASRPRATLAEVAES